MPIEKAFCCTSWVGSLSLWSNGVHEKETKNPRVHYCFLVETYTTWFVYMNFSGCDALLLVFLLLPSCLLIFWVLQTPVRHHFGHLSDPYHWNKEVLPRWPQNITNCMLPFLWHFWKGKNIVMEKGTVVRNWGTSNK